MKFFFSFYRNSIYLIFFIKLEFCCWTDKSEVCHLSSILWSSRLIYCIFCKGLLPSNHYKSISWKILPYYLKSTKFSSDKVSLVMSLSSDYWNLFLYLRILLFYLLVMSYWKVKSTFHSCNFFFFSIESDKNVPCSKMPISIDSVR